MDPLSIATGCAGLVQAIGSLSLSINTFVRTCREARGDLDRVSRELHSLQTVLELIEEDVKDDTKAFPPTIQHHVSGIVTNCSSVVVEVQTCITKYGDGRLKSKAAWAINGQGDMETLRSSLEAHKSALELALDMLSLSLTKDIKTDTTELRNDTAAIKDDTTQILQEIVQLQARLPDTAAAPNDYILQKFLEDMATYTETTLDVDAGGSDRSSFRALSFIDERAESPVGSPQEDLPMLRGQHPESPQPTQGLHWEDHEEFEITHAGTRAIQDRSHGDWQRPSNEDLPQHPFGPGPGIPHSTALENTTPQAHISNAAQPIQPNQYDLPVATPSSDARSPSPNTSEANFPNQNHDRQKPTTPSSSTSHKVPGTPDSPMPEGHGPNRHKKGHKMVTFKGNFVVDALMPEHMLKKVPHGERGEFTHFRFTFVTTPPDQFMSQGFVLRPSMFAKQRDIKFILAMELGDLEDASSFASRWNMISESILYANQRLAESGLVQDVWKHVIVHLHQTPGLGGDVSSIAKVLQAIGAKQDLDVGITKLNRTHLTEPIHQNSETIQGKQVHCTIHEYTSQLRPVNTNNFDPISPTVSRGIPIQVILTETPASEVPKLHGIALSNFSRWAGAIQKAVKAQHVIDMGWMLGVPEDENRFLYEAWTTKKDLTKIQQVGTFLEYLRLDELIMQLRQNSFKKTAANFARRFSRRSDEKAGHSNDYLD